MQLKIQKDGAKSGQLACHPTPPSSQMLFQIRPAGKLCPPPPLASHLASPSSHFSAERGDSHQVNQETFSLPTLEIFLTCRYLLVILICIQSSGELIMAPEKSWDYLLHIKFANQFPNPWKNYT